jgi:signal transduction histidine kinase
VEIEIERVRGDDAVALELVAAMETEGSSALRARRHSDRARRFTRGWASLRGREPLATRRHDDRRPRQADRPPHEDRRRRGAHATGPVAVYGRRLDAQGAVGGPVVVAGRLWGAMIVSSRPAEPMPAGTEGWIEEFAELVATAIANVQARTDLAASRARIVAAADDERRRVVRDLHDGAQQRLVHTVITLKLAQQALQRDDRTPSLASSRSPIVDCSPEACC